MKKILVIQQKMIGDVLLSSILCEWLKKQYPNSEVHYCVYAHTLPVIENNPYIDRIVVFEARYKKSKKAFWQFLRNIQKEHYDWVIDAYGKTESNLISWFSRAKERVSYKKWYSQCIYTKTASRKPVVYTTAGNALEDRLRLLFPEEDIKDHILKPTIYLTTTEREAARDRLTAQGIDFNKPLIMMGVLGSSKAKSMPLDYMAKLIDETVSQTRGQILFNYIPSQLPEAKKIWEGTSKSSRPYIHFGIYGKGLREFINILSHCSMLIGNEGGAVNMAKALDVPTFTVFSPWIHKKAWSMFEDGVQHVSVHLSDFNPELYQNTQIKDLKKHSEALYQKLTPEKMTPSLKKFIANHLNAQ